MILLAIVVAGLIADELPRPGLVARFGSPEFRHPRHASLLGTSADGKRLYTVESEHFYRRDATLFVWDAATGKLIATHQLGGEGAQSISTVALGPEGVRVLDRVEHGWAHRLRVLNPDSGGTVRTGKAWKEEPQVVIHGGFGDHWYNFSADAAWMIRPAKQGYDLYNTATGDKTAIDLDGAAPGFGGEYGFSADGRLFYSSKEKTGVRLHELSSGKHLATLDNPGNEQHAATLTPDAKHLMLWVRRGEKWSLDAYEIARKSRRTVLADRSLPGRVHFAPDGKQFALVPGRLGSHYPAGDWEVREFATGKELGRLPAVGYTTRAFFSPDGRTLYTQPGGYAVVPWNVATGKATAGAPTILGPVEHFRFAPDGRLVGLAGGFVYTWDATTAKELARDRVPKLIDWYGGATFGPTADRLHYTGLNDRVIAWDFRDGAVRESDLALQRFPNAGVAQWFTPDGSLHLEYRYNDGQVVFHDPATGKETARVALPTQWRELRGAPGVHGIALSPDGTRVAIGGDTPSHPGGEKSPPTPIAIVDLGGKGKPVLIEGRGRAAALAFSPDGRVLAAGLAASPEGRWSTAVAGREEPAAAVGVWNAHNGRRVATIPVSPTSTQINALRFSPDGRTLAVSHGRHEVLLVEAASWQVRGRVPVPGWESDTYFGNDRYRDVVAWSPEGRRLATATPDGSLLVWDVRKLGAVTPVTDVASAGRAWSAVNGTDAKAASAATRALAEAPDHAVALLRSQVAPVVAPDAAKIRATITALDAEEFAHREAATAELLKLGPLAELALREAVSTTTSAEVARRGGAILDRLAVAKPTREDVLATRAVEIAEWSATPGAVLLLEAWARGAQGAKLTAEAKAALSRLQK
jgi:WD40 repeat protein